MPQKTYADINPVNAKERRALKAKPVEVEADKTEEKEEKKARRKKWDD